MGNRRERLLSASARRTETKWGLGSSLPAFARPVPGEEPRGRRRRGPPAAIAPVAPHTVASRRARRRMAAPVRVRHQPPTPTAVRRP